MKQTALSLILVLTALFAQAQPETKKDSVRMVLKDGTQVIILTDDVRKVEKIDLNRMISKLSRDMAALSRQMAEDLKEVDSLQQSGTITAEEAQIRRDNIQESYEEQMEALGEEMEVWGEAYGESMEDWGEEYGSRWEEWAERWEREAEDMDEGEMPPMPPLPDLPNTKQKNTVIIDKDGMRIETKVEKTDKRTRTKAQGDIHFGFNQLFDQDGAFADGNAEVNPWKSYNFSLGVAGKTRLFGENSKFYIRYGGLWSWNQFRLKGPNMIMKTPDVDGNPVATFGPDPNFPNVGKSKFTVVYLDVPVMFQFDSSPRGMDNKFTLGVGGYGGVRIYTVKKMKFSDFANDNAEQHLTSDFNMNRWRYGLMAQVGFHSFKITAKYDLSKLFQDNQPADQNYQIASITLGFAY